MTGFLTNRSNKVFVTEVVKDIHYYYGRIASELGVEVRIHTESFFHPTASGMYEDGVIHINLTNRSIEYHERSKANYIVAMAHELGHAYDYLVEARNTPWVRALVSKRFKNKHILEVEHAAYMNGLHYVPLMYKAAYIRKNEEYIGKLEQDAMFMQRGAM